MDNNKLLDKLKNRNVYPAGFGYVAGTLCPQLVSHNGKEFVLFISNGGTKVSIWWDEDNKNYQVVVGDFPKTWEEQYPSKIDFNDFWDGFHNKKPQPKRKSYRTFKRALGLVCETIAEG